MAALLTTQSQLACPHQGVVTIVSSNTRAKADGAFIARPSDTFTIAGCSFVLAGSPHPCVSVQWIVPTLKNRAAGDSALNEDSVGLVLAADQAPQGVVQVRSTQTKVSGQ